MKKTSVRCTGLDAKGVQCGRMVRVKNLQQGQPILCAIHQSQPVGQQTQFTKSTDLDDLLDGLLKSRNENIVLRAIELKREIEKEKGQQTQLQPADGGLDFNLLLPEERDEFKFHIAMIDAAKTRFRERLAAMSPAELAAARAAAEEPPPTGIYRPPAPDTVIAPVPLPVEQPTPTPSEPATEPSETLDKRLWHMVGLYTTRSGTITHAQGDEYAADVLTGKIPYAEAVERQERALHQFNTLTASLKNED